MRRLIVSCAIIIIAFVVSINLDAQSQPQWHEVTYEVNLPSLVDPHTSDGIEIYSKDGTIIIKTPKNVQVKVFTILGQLISQDVINRGVSELKINSRGIFIIKIGGITQKIAL
ncbi:MAG: hypothetical protein RR061_07310 [Muribaculaceae bacterium]